MNRHALVSVGLLVASSVFAVSGCEDDPTKPSGDAGQAGQAGPSPSAGEGSGGSGSVMPQAGEGGVPGGGSQSEGGTGAGGGSQSEGGTGGVPSEGGAGGSAAEDDVCIIPRAFGALSTLPGTLGQGGSSALIWRGELPLEAPAAGTVNVELFAGHPPFEDGITTLNDHVLTGPDLNYGTCGLCVRLVALPTGDEGSPRAYYVTGGTITVSEVEGAMVGTASNLTFEEVTIDETTYYSTPVPDGCETSITSVGFDETLGAGGSGGAGG